MNKLLRLNARRMGGTSNRIAAAQICCRHRIASEASQRGSSMSRCSCEWRGFAGCWAGNQQKRCARTWRAKLAAGGTDDVELPVKLCRKGEAGRVGIIAAKRLPCL